MVATVVLATSSQIRRELFQKYFRDQTDLEVILKSPDIDEKAAGANCLEASDKVIRIARAKMEAMQPDPLLVGECTLAFDSVVVIDGNIREKPQSLEEAREFLRSYVKGTSFGIVNGVAVFHGSSGILVEADQVQVDIVADIPATVLEEWIEARDCLYSAGAVLVEMMEPYIHIHGTVDACQGLPVELVRSMMKKADFI